MLAHSIPYKNRRGPNLLNRRGHLAFAPLEVWASFCTRLFLVCNFAPNLVSLLLYVRIRSSVTPWYFGSKIVKKINKKKKFQTFVLHGSKKFVLATSYLDGNINFGVQLRRCTRWSIWMGNGLTSFNFFNFTCFENFLCVWDKYSNEGQFSGLF